MLNVEIPKVRNEKHPSASINPANQPGKYNGNELGAISGVIVERRSYLEALRTPPKELFHT
jgi:hypothetical protein